MPVNVSNAVRFSYVVIPIIPPVCTLPNAVETSERPIGLQAVAAWLAAVEGVVVRDQRASANPVQRDGLAPVVVVVVNFLCSTSPVSSALCPVIQYLDVVQVAVSNDESTAAVGVHSPARRITAINSVVNVPIFEEKEVGASVPTRLSPSLIAIGRAPVISSILASLGL